MNQVIVTSLELKKKFNISNFEIKGQGYELTVDIILKNDVDDFSLQENMKLITFLDNEKIELKVYADNIVYYNGNLSVIENFNLYQDIYIYKIEETDNNIVYYFNIDNIILNKSNVYLFINSINYSIEVNFDNNSIIVPKSDINLIDKLQVNQYYYMTNLLKKKSVNTITEYLKIINVDEDINLDGDNLYYLNDNIEVKNIKKLENKSFQVISNINNPEVLISDKVEKVSDAINYNSFQMLDEKVYLINTKNDYINSNSIIVSKNISHNIFKIGDDILFESKITDLDVENSFVENKFILTLNEEDGFYYTNEIYLDFVNEDEDYILSYHYFDNEENKINLTIDNVVGNKFKLSESSTKEIELFQRIKFNKSVFSFYQYDNILVLNTGEHGDLAKNLKGNIHIDNTINIFEIPIPKSILENAIININIDNQLTDVILIENAVNKFFIKFEGIIELNNKCYFTSDENIIDGLIF